MHKPSEWMVVNDSPLIVTAMCTCGSDDCAYTVTAYEAVNTNLEPVKYVRL